VWERAIATAVEGFLPGGGSQFREATHRFLGRVAGAIDSAFAPYLPAAIPPALEALSGRTGEEVRQYF
jgi:hypothetical protein